ncbi:MAG: DUF1259 domain-containing protein [Armatimonadetes bacterium]|nr:DUF1259 domain-containing protein [Armatimonadota bacterium]
MKPTYLSFALFASLLTSQSFGQQTPPTPYTDAAKIIGKNGTLNADGTYRINFPRNDVTFENSRGMAIPTDLGLATYIAFSSPTDHSLAVGDVAMLEGEIDGVIDALRKADFEIVSLHNHMTSEQPRLFYLHFQKVGSPADLAKGFKPALDILGHGEEIKVLPKMGKPEIDKEALGKIFGAAPQVFPSGVVRFATPRKDLNVKVLDESFTPGMGLGSWVAFSGCECGLTMAMGDTCCTQKDLQHSIDALRKVGIHITAIHRHVFGGSTDTAFMHYEGEGDVLKLAGGVKNCWDGLGG